MIALVFNEFLRGVCDLIYPPNCLLCKKQIPASDPKEFLCLNCQNSLSSNFPPFCVKCSRHLKSVNPHPKCKSCRAHAPHFDFAWSACLYDGAMKDLLYQFKYYQRTYLRKAFMRLIKEYIDKHYLDIAQFHWIVPIPLSSTRLRERGYNQAALLAQAVSEEFHIPLSVNNLMKIRHTLSQTALDEKERWTNNQGAFKIKRPKTYSDQSILLIDDLLTTGATVSEAAHECKKAGAKTVGVLTLAIAV